MVSYDDQEKTVEIPTKKESDLTRILHVISADCVRPSSSYETNKFCSFTKQRMKKKETCYSPLLVSCELLFLGHSVCVFHIRAECSICFYPVLLLV